jgi:hypothetical protein
MTTMLHILAPLSGHGYALKEKLEFIHYQIENIFLFCKETQKNHFSKRGKWGTYSLDNFFKFFSSYLATIIMIVVYHLFILHNFFSESSLGTRPLLPPLKKTKCI